MSVGLEEDTVANDECGGRIAHKVEKRRGLGWSIIVPHCRDEDERTLKIGESFWGWVRRADATAVVNCRRGALLRLEWTSTRDMMIAFGANRR